MVTSLTVTGLGRCRRLVMKKIDKQRHEKIMEEFMKSVYELIKQNAARLSGEMESAVFLTKSGVLSYKVGCTAPQAVWNEFGTYFMPVGSESNPLAVVSGSGKRAYRPFIRPAMYSILKKYPNIVKKYLFNK